MRAPAGLEKLDPHGEMSPGPYPPLGFLPVWDAEGGNGDYYGLHWPLGREAREPIVCDMLHDEWGLAPAFSSVEKFVAWLTLNGGRRGEAEIDDPEFAPAHFAQAKSQIERGDIDGAISRLRSACDSVPDACDYWFTLATQLQRIGKHDESTDAALRAFRSSWFFGMPSDAVLRTIRKEQGNSAFASDPLVTRSNELTTKFGGTKENRNYALLRECVADYLDRGCAVEALQLYQNYAFMMCSETTAFQERHSFALEVWRVEFSKLCGKHLRDARVAVT